jgi:DNA-binding CsgD family transcriptional regulator
MAVILPAPAPLVIGIALNRSSRDFSERGRLLLNLLRPHLIQAYRNAESATRLRRELALMARALEESDRGMVVLTRSRQVRYYTERAREWISEYFEPARRTDQLPESLQRWVEHQQSLLSKNGDVPPPREPLTLERAGKRLVVRLVEDRPEERCLLILEEQILRFSAGLLEPLGLTRREAQVLLWVARGKTDKEVAAILYISSRTVKKHLEHVYQKLGVESRTTRPWFGYCRFSAFSTNEPQTIPESGCADLLNATNPTLYGSGAVGPRLRRGSHPKLHASAL